MNSELDRYLSLSDVSINYDAERILRSISFSFRSGEIGCLIGPRGCGKTSLLRAIAGFEPLSAGSHTLTHKDITQNRYLFPPSHRHKSMVITDSTLYPAIHRVEH